MKKMVKPADLILSAALIMLSFSLWIFFPRPSSGPAQAKIRVGGELYAALDLTKEERLEIIGPGGYKNVIEVKDGAVYFAESDCPDHLCIKFGKLQKAGGFAACVPNRVSVEVEASGDAEIDVIA